MQRPPTNKSSHCIGLHHHILASLSVYFSLCGCITHRCLSTFTSLFIHHTHVPVYISIIYAPHGYGHTPYCQGLLGINLEYTSKLDMNITTTFFERIGRMVCFPVNGCWVIWHYYISVWVGVCVCGEGSPPEAAESTSVSPDGQSSGWPEEFTCEHDMAPNPADIWWVQVYLLFNIAWFFVFVF